MKKSSNYFILFNSILLLVVFMYVFSSILSTFSISDVSLENILSFSSYQARSNPSDSRPFDRMDNFYGFTGGILINPDGNCDANRVLSEIKKGEEDSTLEKLNWGKEICKEKNLINRLDQMLPIHGNWAFSNNHISHLDTVIQQSLLLFAPMIQNGEITLKAKMDKGNEDIRIIFGFKSISDFYLWDIGGQMSQTSIIEKWSKRKPPPGRRGQNREPRYIKQNLTEVTPLTFSPQIFHDIRMVIDSAKGTIEGFVDQKKILSFVATEPIDGHLGIGTWNTSAEFESIQITGNESGI